MGPSASLVLRCHRYYYFVYLLPIFLLSLSSSSFLVLPFPSTSTLRLLLSSLLCFPPLSPPFFLRRFPLLSVSVLRYPRTFLYFLSCFCFALSHLRFLSCSCCVLVSFSFAVCGCYFVVIVIVILSSVVSVFCGWAIVRAFLCWCFPLLSSLSLCVVFGSVLGVVLFPSRRARYPLLDHPIT